MEGRGDRERKGVDNSSCIGNSNKIYHSFVNLSTMRKCDRQPGGVFANRSGSAATAGSAVGRRRGESGTEGGGVVGNRTVSANESWRRIAICNFMAVSLETEGAQEQATKQAGAQPKDQGEQGGERSSSRSRSRNRSRETATDIAAIQNKPI